jgi:hypothetical protein
MHPNVGQAGTALRMGSSVPWLQSLQGSEPPGNAGSMPGGYVRSRVLEVPSKTNRLIVPGPERGGGTSLNGPGDA